MKKWSFALLLLACLVAAGYWFVAIPATSTPNGSESRARFNPGPYEVDGERFTIVDRDRATPAFDGSPERPERELDGELWRPADRALPGPLVIYSHGFLSFRQEAMYLARFLASHGYTVAAVDLPLTSIYALDDPQMGYPPTVDSDAGPAANSAKTLPVAKCWSEIRFEGKPLILADSR